MTSLILDTCAAIWLAEDAEIATVTVEAIERCVSTGGAVFVSPITAWEIGVLVARGRLALTLAPDVWFERLLQAPDVRLAEMPPAVLIASSFLPGAGLPRDPADRIIAATARAYDLVLLTRDKPLLSYAAAGNLKAVAC